MKKIEAIPGYIIFFDNIRMDPFIKSFSCTTSNDGTINRAAIEMIYMPELSKVIRQSAVYGVDFYEDAIENMTNVKIFIKNIFNNKYTLVYDGNIRSKTVTESPNGNSLVYNAADHLDELNKTIAPIAITLDDALNITQNSFRMRAEGINTRNIDPLRNQGQNLFKGKKIREILQKIRSQALSSNSIYADTEGVLYWNNASGRIDVMGDITEELRQYELADLRPSIDTLNVDSMYILLNDILQKLMFEFYQDRDGVIRVKPPFWNEKVLMNHVIDASLVVSFSEFDAWESMYTRVITMGGVNQEFLESIQNSGNTELGKVLTIPMGAYVGEVYSQGKWADSRVSQATSDIDINYVYSKMEKGKTGVSWLDSENYVTSWTDDKSGAEWRVSPRHPITHVGGSGKVVDIQRDSAGINVAVQLSDGPYSGFTVCYMKLSSPSVTVGQNVSGGTLIGIASGSQGKNNPLRVEIHSNNYGISSNFGSQFKSLETVDPITYFRDCTVQATSSTLYAIKTVGIDNLLSPTMLERKYGVSVFDNTQPLIKFSNSGGGDLAYTVLKKYSAFLYNMLNSMAATANVQLIGSPWIRPGMNLWLSPTKNDKVYYVASVTHSGDPQNGVFTTLRLIHGRNSKAFFLGDESVFGTLRDRKDNIFINEINQKPESFGPVVSNVQSYLSLKQKAADFHNSNNDGIIKADRCPYLQSLYASGGPHDYGYSDISNSQCSSMLHNATGIAGNNTLADFIFDSDMTISQIQVMLNYLYSKAPQVVKMRSSKVQGVADLSKKNAYKYYINSVFKK
jgi:murein DD-endopeptidase MepM/ murein hydrolase activator NlpD